MIRRRIGTTQSASAGTANRWGSNVYSAAEQKAIQEVITVSIFVVFSFLYLGQKITIGQGLGFALIAAGAFLVFRNSLVPVPA